MPHHQSAIKRVRQNKRRQERNRINRSALRTAIKKVRKATNKEEGQTFLPQAYSLLDKAIKRNLLHAKTASRYKSRLASFVNKLS